MNDFLKGITKPLVYGTAGALATFTIPSYSPDSTFPQNLIQLTAIPLAAAGLVYITETHLIKEGGALKKALYMGAGCVIGNLASIVIR